VNLILPKKKLKNPPKKSPAIVKVKGEKKTLERSNFIDKIFYSE
jgi:hypothetical protein